MVVCNALLQQKSIFNLSGTQYMLVLSLKRDIERRKKICEQIDSLGKKFEFFDAYTPTSIPQEVLRNSNKELTDGEKACAYSHLMIYEKLLKSENKYEVILEDDALLEQSFLDYFNKVSRLHDIYDVVIFGYSKVDVELAKIMKFVRPSIKLKVDDFYIRLPYRQWHCGTVGYSISRSGANKILEINRSLEVPADYWEYFEDHGVSVVHYSDILVTEDFINFKSHLEGQRGTFNNPNIFLRLLAGILRHFVLPFRIYSWNKKFKIKH